MNRELFLQAQELDKQIQIIDHELRVLNEQTLCPVRFGTNFNVSIPITISEDTFFSFVSLLKTEKAKELFDLQIKFLEL